MSKKKLDRLNPKLRSVGIHRFQFVKFLRYLKQYDAKITIGNPYNSSRNTYLANTKKDEPSLQSLIALALNRSDSYVQELISRKVTLNDRYSNKERFEGLGNTLTDIEFGLVNEESESDKIKSLFESSFKYYRRERFDKPALQDLSSNSVPLNFERELDREFTASNSFKNILKNSLNASINNAISDLYVGKFTGVVLSKLPYFGNAVAQLRDLLKAKQERVDDIFLIKVELLKLSRPYNLMLDSHDLRTSLLPNYRDFATLAVEEGPNKSIELNTEIHPDEFIHQVVSFDYPNLLYFRYEILKKMMWDEKTLTNWPNALIALLIFCNFELSGILEMLREIIFQVLHSVRFKILTRNSHNDTISVENLLNLDELVSILLEYQLNKPIEELLSIKNTNILTTSLYKYPERFIEDNFSFGMELKQKIHDMLFSEIRNKFVQDQRMSKDLWPPEGIDTLLY